MASSSLSYTPGDIPKPRAGLPARAFNLVSLAE